MELVPVAMLDFPNGDQRFKKVPPILMDSLVQEPKRRAVPNHLLETKSYTKLTSNRIVQASPGILHFGGYEVGKQYKQTLKLINISQDVMTLHIIPPQTKHFSISYNKTHRLVPGLAYTISVHFTPDEWRYYYDCVRVHGKGDETLLVPLHAYPITNQVDFPSNINFPDVALGQSKQYIIPLRCSCPIDFEFFIFCTQSTQAFTISPTSGTVPANGVTEVTVQYTPCDYGTARMEMELLVSEFNAKPLTCVFTGTCKPHLSAAKETIERTRISLKTQREDTEKAMGLVSRKKKHLQTLQLNASSFIEYQNLRFPLNLSNPYSVSTVLNQQPGKLKAKDLREGNPPVCTNTRQAKETLFEQMVQHNVAEEEANQLRWQVHLGSDPITPKLRQKVTEDRKRAQIEYKVRKGSPVLEREFKRECVDIISQRVLRRVDQRPNFQPQFDLFVNNLWADRHRALKRFQQAASKVLIHCRINHRLFLLKKLVERLKTKEEGKERSESGVKEDLFLKSSVCVSGYEFPCCPAEYDSVSSAGVESASPKPVSVKIKQVLPFYELKVPQHYRIMGYQPVSSDQACSSYKSQALARALRTGAEDELMSPCGAQKTPSLAEPPQLQQIDLQTKDKEETPRNGVMTLVPPEQMLNPPDYHPMHVFNPAPGLVALKRPLSYSETDIEYHFCPLPKYPLLRASPHAVGSVNTQKRFLNREEIIRGVMNWRKFPTIALSVTSPGAGDKRPRWCDPFNTDLLPVEPPSTLSDLLETDKENIGTKDGEDEDAKVWLTPSMLRAEFPLVQTASGAPEIEPAEMENETVEQSDTLPDKISEHLRQLKMLSHNNRLILH
ncbi:cilia- and flagella-associated protein 221 [Pelodytes ibericus]